MKNIYLSTLLLTGLFTTALQAQNIGIGEAAPSTKLEIRGDGGNLFNVKDNSNDSKLFVNSNGYVGIGTTNPYGLLNISITNVFDPNDSQNPSNSLILYTGAANSVGNHYGAIVWQGDASRKKAAITSVMERADGDFVGLAFWTQRTDGPGDISESMRIAHNGNVGIGTPDPNAKLEISGNLLLQSGTAVNEFSTDGTLVGNSDDAIPTEQAVKTYVDNLVSGEDDWDKSGNNIYNNNTGNVGVGATSPNKKLQVLGSGDNGSFVPTNWQIAAGESGAGEVLIGTYEDQPAIQGHGSGTAYRLLLNPTNGNVGIGTTDPSAALDIKGALKFDSELDFPAEGSLNEGAWNAYMIAGEGGDRTLRLGTVNDSYTRAEIEIENNNTSSGTIKFKTTTTGGADERMRIAGNGNVSIGTTNTGTYKLFVNGSTRTNSLNINGAYNLPTTDGSSNYVLRTNGSGSAAWADANSLVSGDNLGNHSATQDINLNNNAIIASNNPPSNIDHIYHDDATSGDAGGKWAFVSDGSMLGTGNSRLEAGHVYMTGSNHENYFAGNVGIGHNDAPHKLFVQGGSGYFSTSTNIDPLVIARNYKTSNFEEMRIGLEDTRMEFYYINDESANRVDFRLHNTDTESGGGASANDNTVLTLESTTAGGMVGINNVTNPSYHLHVNGRILSNGINETSDKRLKKGFEKLGKALDKVKQINGVYYNWRTEEFPELEFDEDRQLGVVAQEIQEVLPEIVDEDDEGYLSVEYGHLIPLLIEAVK